jgi:two-component system OmpR family sensor kinase
MVGRFGPGQPPDGLDRDGFRLGELRRPRQFGLDGRSLSEPGDTPIDSRAIAEARQGRPIYSDGLFQEEPVRIYTEPWIDRGQVLGIVQVAREKRDLVRLWKSQAATLFVFLPGVLFAAALGALFLTGRAIGPIAKLRDAASRISESNLTERIPVEGNDELADLGNSFNAMVSRLEESFGSLREAYENQKRFTADASHELRTPLTRLKLAASGSLNDSSPQQMREALEVANNAADQMSHLVDQLLVLAKADAGQLDFRKSRVDVRVVVGQAIDRTPNPTKVEIKSDFPGQALYAEVDSGAIERVASNLLANAYRYSPPDHPVLVRLSDFGDDIELLVSDEGEGIPPELLPKIGDRFFRVDSARSEGAGGTGLGLAICKAILEAHGGRLDVASASGKGTTVKAYFSKKVVDDRNQTTSS